MTPLKQTQERKTWFNKEQKLLIEGAIYGASIGVGLSCIVISLKSIIYG